jgi:hypothetical protein
MSEQSKPQPRRTPPNPNNTSLARTQLREPEPVPVLEAPPAPIVTATPNSVVIEAPVMPPDDAPAIEVPRAAMSYKVPFSFSEANGWKVSYDGGKEAEDSGTLVISGRPLDLSLSITPASWQEGALDWRVSLEFVNRDGVICEINLNGLRPSKEDPTQLVLTGPCRSLIGSLMAVTDETDANVEQNIHCFANAARFTLCKGNVARSQFIETSILRTTNEGELLWVKFAGAKLTNRVPNYPHGLIRSIEAIKQSMRERGYFSATPAVLGRENLGDHEDDAIQVTPVITTIVNDN